MRNLSESTLNFLNEYVMPKLNIKELNDTNIEIILDYLTDKIETPLIMAIQAGDKLSLDEERLLEEATNAITDITKND